MKLLKRTWADVSLDALAHNYHAIRGHIPAGCKFLGVMKADAYGHGAVPLSHALVDLGAEYLAVSNLEEAVQIRRGGIRAPILILGYTPAMYAENMIYLDLTQEVHSLAYARELNDALSGTNFILNVHLKLDTGMTRIGFTAYGDEAALSEMVAAAKLPHLHVEGAFMHFSVADSRAEEDVAFTHLQYQRFVAALSYLQSAGIELEVRHCCNSGATLLYPEYAMDMVRPGIMTYGLCPSPDTAGILDLEPVLRLYTTVSQIRTFPAGVDVSYGHLYHKAGAAPGGAPHRLCRRTFAQPFGQGGVLAPRQARAGGGADLHGYVHGGCDGHSRSPGGRHCGGDLPGAPLRGAGRPAWHYLL